MASNLTTFALYTPALALIAGERACAPSARPGRAGHPADHAHGGLGAAGVRGRGPGRVYSSAAVAGGWMNANNRWIQVVLGLGFGVWLLVKGMNGL